MIPPLGGIFLLTIWRFSGKLSAGSLNDSFSTDEGENKMLCARCNAAEAIGQGQATVMIHGIEVKGTLGKNTQGDICHECLSKKLVKGVDCLIEAGFFKIEEGKVIVNWKKCYGRCLVGDIGFNDVAWGWLEKFGVISSEPNGNYMLMNGGEQFFHHHRLRKIFFTRLEDAIDCVREYNEECLDNRLSIFRMEKVNF